jgi:hypothetical protein
MLRDSLLEMMGKAFTVMANAANLQAHRAQMRPRTSYGLELRLVKKDGLLAEASTLNRRSGDSYAITMTHVPSGKRYRAAGPDSREAKRRRARMGAA